jgi:hypothetical protein
MFIIRWKSEAAYGQVGALHEIPAFHGVVLGPGS